MFRRFYKDVRKLNKPGRLYGIPMCSTEMKWNEMKSFNHVGHKMTLMIVRIYIYCLVRKSIGRAVRKKSQARKLTPLFHYSCFTDQETKKENVRSCWLQPPTSFLYYMYIKLILNYDNYLLKYKINKNSFTFDSLQLKCSIGLPYLECVP